MVLTGARRPRIPSCWCSGTRTRAARPGRPGGPAIRAAAVLSCRPGRPRPGPRPRRVRVPCRVHVAERIVRYHRQPTREHRGRAGGHRVHEEFRGAGEDLIGPERIGDDRAAGAEHHRDGQAAPRHGPRRWPALRWGGAGPRHRGTGQSYPRRLRARRPGRTETLSGPISHHLTEHHRPGDAPSTRTRRTCGAEPGRLDPRCKVHCLPK